MRIFYCSLVFYSNWLIDVNVSLNEKLLIGGIQNGGI